MEYLLGILMDISESGTLSLVGKQKHMLKSGAPHDRFRVLYHLSCMEFFCLNNFS